MFLRRILITMTALTNGTLMTTLVLNGTNRIQCILSSYIINIVSVRLLQCTSHIIDVRKTLMLLYTTSSGTCTVCSGIPPFLLLWWSDNFTTMYCPAQHDRSDAKFIIIIISFSFYPVHILTLSSFEICNVFADIAMMRLDDPNGPLFVLFHSQRSNLRWSFSFRPKLCFSTFQLQFDMSLQTSSI